MNNPQTNLLPDFVLPTIDEEYPYLAIFKTGSLVRTQSFKMFNSASHFMIEVEDKGGMPLALVSPGLVLWKDAHLSDEDEARLLAKPVQIQS